MASPPRGGNLQKVDHGHGLGKSTLVGKLNLSIPMPRGASPPPNPDGRPQTKPADSGSAPSGQGAKSNG